MARNALIWNWSHTEVIAPDKIGHFAPIGTLKNLLVVDKWSAPFGSR
ncbi:hypothetical protein ACPOL_6961 (plasmid) [Acidisarcina polymorpha]|uniref:Uncharacterized protein n=1 Tax=Acidisarcina polymorpha TaxID=2211140 RepID=A0A2Z5GC33_9BACT|nr:hypothetical protein [Acidisarcina polymorpha]AXC16165.1 hypothetical protein ACPOL_6961 [Acidisarcina polymorpha]